MGITSSKRKPANPNLQEFTELIKKINENSSIVECDLTTIEKVNGNMVVTVNHVDEPMHKVVITFKRTEGKWKLKDRTKTPQKKGTFPGQYTMTAMLAELALLIQQEASKQAVQPTQEYLDNQKKLQARTEHSRRVEYLREHSRKPSRPPPPVPAPAPAPASPTAQLPPLPRKPYEEVLHPKAPRSTLLF